MSERKCYKCGAAHARDVDNLRPYGPSGQDVCFTCAMGTPEDEAAARAQMAAAMEKIKGPVVLTQDGPKGIAEVDMRQDPLAVVVNPPRKQ